VLSTSSPSSLDPVIHAWPEAMLLVSGRGVVRCANAAARRLLRLPDAPSADVSVVDVFGATAAAALLPVEGPGGTCQLGADAASPGASIVRARSGRLPDGDFLVRVSDASDEHRLRSHIEHAERLASIGELLSSVAHELSNPLTTVLGYADLLLCDDDDDRIPREELEKIRSEALRCRRIVGNLLDLSRAETFEARPIAPAEVIDRVIEFRAYAAKVGQIQLVRECDADVPVVDGDQHRLVQAVLNLVTNAEDAVRTRPQDRRIVLRARRATAGVRIEVEDNGPGVPEAIREFVFEPFFTTKPRGRGTGLGLSLVRAAAQAHGGSVRVENATGGGALFVIELPAAE
jgi:signal transduction histidine kinase